MRICGCHANNYNNTYFCELSQMNLENAFIDLNNFTMDLAYEMEIRTIVKEDVTVRDINKGDNKKPKNLIDRIKRVIGNLIKYIRNIIASFINKVDDLINNNDDWLADNADKVNGISKEFWAACEISLYPYNFDHQYRGKQVYQEGIYAYAIEPNTNSKVTQQILNGFENKEEFYKTVAPQIYKLDSDDFTNACKTYYRGGKNVVTYTGNTAEKLCSHGIQYCLNYKALSNKIKSDLNKFRGDVEKFEDESNRRANQQGAIESFDWDNKFWSILEEKYIYYDEITNENLNIVMEKLPSQAYKELVGDDKQKNGSVTMDEKPNGEKNTDNTPSQPSEKSQASQHFTRLLEYYRTALTVQTARMTIAEEAYNAYIRTVKTVIRTAENRKEISAMRGQNKKKGVIKRTGETIARGVKKLTGTDNASE